MKYIILILLIACGRNETPDKKDLGDLDGDLIPNHLEAGLDKHIARIDVLPKIRGVLSFVPEKSQTEVVIKLNNQRNLEADSLELITKRSSLLKSEEYFNEWSRLRLVSLIPKVDLPLSFYTITFRFEIPAKNPHALVLVKNGHFKKLADWSTEITVPLSNEELSDILKGNAYLAFSTQWLESKPFTGGTLFESIKSKTYRVFFHDGEETKVLYVSRNLPFDKLKKELGVMESINTDEINLFSMNNMPQEKMWWSRSISADEKILIFTNPENISNAFKKNFNIIEFKISRKNGISNEAFRISKPADARLYFKIEAERSLREFITYKEKKNHYVTGPQHGPDHTEVGNSYSCTYFMRKIKREVNQSVTTNEIIKALEIMFDGNSNYIEKAQFFHQLHQGEYESWTLGFNEKIKEIELRLNNLPVETFVQNGIYETKCNKGFKSKEDTKEVLANFEGKMDLRIEAYIEKLE